MPEKLAELERKFIDLSDKINDPDIISNNEEWRRLMKEHSELAPIIEKYREYKDAEKSIAEATEMLEDSDEEMRLLAREELKAAEEMLERTKIQLKRLMLPKDPNDDKNVIVEIRGGAGGDEANIFASARREASERYRS